jgi:hypothetical protein
MTENEQILEGLKTMLFFMADQQEQIRKVLIDFQAVIKVTEEQKPDFVKIRDQIRQARKYHDASEIASRLRNIANLLKPTSLGQ